MHLSVPIYRLKREARLLARERNIALHKALDTIAQQQGYASWSLLAARHAVAAPHKRLLFGLRSGGMVLRGGRRGHGKTMIALDLLVQACEAGRRTWFFSLDFNERDIDACIRELGHIAAQKQMMFDTSDAISAAYIMDRLEDEAEGALVVVDYLQILDQQRHKPPLNEQVAALSEFAARTGIIFIFLSQIDRRFDQTGRQLPEAGDVRLPNPLDLTLFSDTWFVNEGVLHAGAAA